MSAADISARLCAACGMCCNGVLFHGVRLQPGDSARQLSALGLKVKRGLLLQPCAAHQGTHCSVYQHRPTRCRLFVCRQLRAVEEGRLSEAAALEKITEARRRVEGLHALFREAGDTRERKALATRCETLLTPPLDPAPKAMEFRERMTSAMRELEDFLREYFRVEARD